MKWQPIATAPKDGTEIIGIFWKQYHVDKKPTIHGPWTVAFRDGKWMASWGDARVLHSEGWWGTEYEEAPLDPTHWMPLPEPPAQDHDEDDADGEFEQREAYRERLAADMAGEDPPEAE